MRTQPWLVSLPLPSSRPPLSASVPKLDIHGQASGRAQQQDSLDSIVKDDSLVKTRFEEVPAIEHI